MSLPDENEVPRIDLQEARNQFANINMGVKCPSNHVENKDNVDFAIRFCKKINFRESSSCYRRLQKGKTLKSSEKPVAFWMTYACAKIFLKTFCLGERGVALSQHRALDAEAYNPAARKAALEFFNKLVEAFLIPLTSGQGNAPICNSVLKHTPIWSAFGKIGYENQLHLIGDANERNAVIDRIVKQLSDIDWFDTSKWTGVCLKKGNTASTPGIKHATRYSFLAMINPENENYGRIRK